mmetsp:Transcript_3155/g.9622  ORF Transcript_3155/g.9622 Transcript_3155/m.9622 type:complete len:255 (+) Transcript_3155:670-1434(+)
MVDSSSDTVVKGASVVAASDMRSAAVVAADVEDAPLEEMAGGTTVVGAGVVVVIGALGSVVTAGGDEIVDGGTDVGMLDGFATVDAPMEEAGLVAVVVVGEVVAVVLEEVAAVVLGLLVGDVVSVVVKDEVPVDDGLDVAVDVTVVVLVVVRVVVGVVSSHSVKVPSPYDIIASLIRSTTLRHTSSSDTFTKPPMPYEKSTCAILSRVYSRMSVLNAKRASSAAVGLTAPTLSAHTPDISRSSWYVYAPTGSWQ